MFQNRDTIAAQATAAGEGGVAIVRVSGADCEAVVSRVFRAKNGKPLANRVLTYGCVMENGEIAAVIIDDEATLKRVYYDRAHARLQLVPENPAYSPLVYVGEELDNIRILGKAVGFMSIF